MILTYNDYLRAITTELERPGLSRLWISTFNINAGVNDRAWIYERSDTYRLFRSINSRKLDSRVMVGVPVGAVTIQKKLVSTAEYFSNIQFKLNSSLHLKCWIFWTNRTPRAIFGGRNVGDSAWLDASTILTTTDSRQLATFYENCWMNSVRVQKSEPLRLR